MKFLQQHINLAPTTREEQDKIAYKIYTNVLNKITIAKVHEILEDAEVLHAEYTMDLEKRLKNIKIIINYQNANLTIDTIKRKISISWCDVCSIAWDWCLGYFDAEYIIDYLDTNEEFRKLIKGGVKIK